jgi:glycosyltransferase involved in cell wall biosynthesis
VLSKTRQYTGRCTRGAREVATIAEIKLSVVIPMYNEEEVLPELFARLRPVLDRIGCPYEVVAVDDGSRDGTAHLVREARPGWPQLRLIRLMRNSGHQAALGAGLLLSHGAYVVSIDADLQDPPEDIPPMVDLAVREGLDVVYGVRSDRTTDSWMKRNTARMYYRLMRRLVGPEVPDGAGDFRLISRRVVHALENLPEHGRVFRLVIPWLGFPSGSHHYVRDKRHAGESKYPLSAMLRLAFDSVTSFSAAPLRLSTWAGAAGGLACVSLLIWAVTAWLLGTAVPGWSSIVIAVTGLGALQLICLGMVGNYVGRLYAIAQSRPAYLIGYDSDQEEPAPAVPGREAKGRSPVSARSRSGAG